MKIYVYHLALMGCMTSFLGAIDPQPISSGKSEVITVTIDNQTDAPIYYRSCESRSIDACLRGGHPGTKIEANSGKALIPLFYTSQQSRKSRMFTYTRFFFSKNPLTQKKDITSVLVPQNAGALCEGNIVFTVTEDPKNPEKLSVTDNCSLTSKVQRSWGRIKERVSRTFKRAQEQEPIKESL